MNPGVFALIFCWSSISWTFGGKEIFIHLIYCSILAMGPIHADVESLELTTLQISAPVLDAEFAVSVVSASFFICLISASLKAEVQSFGSGESVAS